MQSTRTVASSSGVDAIRDLVSLTKPRLSSLVLFTAGAGLWLAPTRPDWLTAVAAVVGVMLLVGAANVFNNYIERESDRFMARTQNRPLPAGRLEATSALLFGLCLLAVSLPTLALMVNTLTALLGVLALVTYVAAYTPMKRRSSVSTFVGAIPGALPPLMGWTAATGSIDLGGMVLFAILFLWQMPHFHAIGMYRAKEYRSAGLVTLATEAGAGAVRQQTLIFTVMLTATVPFLYGLGIGGVVTQLTALVLGLAWVHHAWRGLDHGGNRWARQSFIYSLVYLTALFAVLGVEAR